MTQNQLILSDSARKCAVQFTPHDMAVMLKFARLPFPKIILSCGNTPLQLNRKSILTGLRSFLGHVREKAPFYHYSYQFTDAPAKLRPQVNGTTGFRVKGKICRITGGFMECWLEEFSPTGQARKIDIRKERTIHTDDWGKLQIIRHHQPLTLIKGLTAAMKFLCNSSAATVTVYWAGKLHISFL